MNNTPRHASKEKYLLCNFVSNYLILANILKHLNNTLEPVDKKI